MRYWVFQWYEGENSKQVEYTDQELEDSSGSKNLTYIQLRQRALDYFHQSENVKLSLLQGSVGFSVEERQEDITATVRSWSAG